jgi:hypothetical protein
MPKNKPLETSEVTHIEEMLVKGDEAGMVLEIARKYARVLDMTDSGRDIKPLATGLFEAVDRWKALTGGKDEDTPDADVKRRLESMRARMSKNGG